MSALKLLLVSSNADIMVVQNPFCRTCFEKKTGVKIIREFSLTAPEFRDLAGWGVRGFRVRCECPPRGK